MTTGQVAPLVGLRWRMVRSRRARLGFAAAAAALPALCAVAVAAGMTMPTERSFEVAVLAPTAYLAVAMVAVLAPLVAGGGNELFPDDQLVAYPVTARTTYAASLALTPLNLAWTTQLLGLVWVTAFIAPRSGLVAFSLVTALAYVAAVTLAGQALAWVAVGVRQHRRGRLASWAVAGIALAATVSVVATGSVGRALDGSPTTYVVVAVIGGGSGSWPTWALTTGGLLGVAALGFLAGRPACAWALRQPGGAATRIDASTVARRPQGRGVRAELIATDRASVWRSSSLRRGLVVLAVLPGLVAATAGLDWPSLVLLPGLVAAGAGLLFGVNAFCLDGTGSVWLASLPHRASTAFWCKVQVVAEVALLATVLTVAAGSVRSGRLPTSGEAAAVLCCTAVALLRVVSTCLELSVTRPHRADLRGPRDTPAPPGVMAAYSVRLAVSTTLLALLFSLLAGSAAWQWSVAVALPFVLLSLRRLLRTARRWEDPAVRARVVMTVASG